MAAGGARCAVVRGEHVAGSHQTALRVLGETV